MKVLITGVCGFVGSTVAQTLMDAGNGHQIVGVDSLAQRGSHGNWRYLTSLGVDVRHGDLRLASDLETLGPVDWVIDAAAMPNVLAGVDGKSSSRQLVEHNLLGTINVLEFCKQHQAGLVLLSTSRVYSIEAINRLPLAVERDAFVWDQTLADEQAKEFGGASPHGIQEDFSTESPVSMYGATKLASESLAMEYGLTYQFPVCINRCGVLAGPRQFGHAEQGIFSFWLHSHHARQPMRYFGFGGHGHQVRDCLHAQDLASLVGRQMKKSTDYQAKQLFNVSGGAPSAISLKQLTAWCDDRFGKHNVEASDQTRPFDLPWVVLDGRAAREYWDWNPQFSLMQTLEEIAEHAESNPDWLDQTR